MPPTVTTDNSAGSPVLRIRRSPQAAQDAALNAAQALLLEAGPQAVTLKAVAEAVGMTHGNITHHFGTSATLRARLIARMADRLSVQTNQAVERLRLGEIDAEVVVDLVFSVFAETGCGRLVGWLSATGRHAELAPVFDVILASVRRYRAGEPAGVMEDDVGAGPIALALLSHALTASLIGAELERATEMSAGSLRRVATDQVRRLRAPNLAASSMRSEP